jgi:hypothetical protein
MIREEKALSNESLRVIPLAFTALAVVWTAIISRFTKFGDDWAAIPLFAIFIVTIIAHVSLVIVSRRKLPLVAYGAIHVLFQGWLLTYCIIIVTKNAL